MKRLALIVGVVAFALSALPAHASGCDSWTGATSERWDTSSNWTAGVPSAASQVCISRSAQRKVVVVGREARAASVSLGHGTQLELMADATLRVAHGVRIAGSLTFERPTARLITALARVVRGGRLAGVGAVTGSVVNAGWVMALDGATGVPLRVSGTYRQLRSGVLFSRDEGTSFVQLHAGRASLAGRLILLILDALTPGSRYQIVSAHRLSGTFAHLPLGLVMDYSRRTATAVVRSVVTLGRAHVARGQVVDVSGASFGNLGVVKFHLDSRSGPVLGSASVNSIGGFETPMRLPLHLGLGRHLLVAVKQGVGYMASVRFVVTAG